MIESLLRCGACGSPNVRRSKRQSAGEIPSMLLGVYPFRCLDCGARFFESVWLLSKLGIAKCPRCLRTDLFVWPEKYFRPTPWHNLMLTFGAHRYRCGHCRYNFLSFRPRQGDAAAPPRTQGEQELRDQQAAARK